MIRNPALVLVDFQNSFCSPAHNDSLAADGEAAAAMRRTVERASAFVDRYRETGRTPIWVRSIEELEEAAAAEARQRPGPPPCLPGSPEAAYVDGMAPADDDVVVTKGGYYDGFFETELADRLAANGIDEVLVGGVNTQICVLATAFGAMNRGYDVTVLADCSAASSVEGHDHGLGVLSTIADGVVESTEVALDG